MISTFLTTEVVGPYPKTHHFVWWPPFRLGSGCGLLGLSLARLGCEAVWETFCGFVDFWWRETSSYNRCFSFWGRKGRGSFTVGF